jgi:uncharacterized SAM-binding protein YcdF (DUF218 family)
METARASSEAPVIVIMGAAVRGDGRPGPALVRRTRAALRLGERFPGAVFLPTGGAPGGGPAEADVMARLLVQAGVQPERIVRDDRACDTLESAVNCAAILRRLGATVVLVCTDRYHLPRCRLLFRLAGVTTTAEPVPRDLDTTAPLTRLFYGARELVALPIDACLFVLRRIRAARAGDRG